MDLVRIFRILKLVQVSIGSDNRLKFGYLSKFAGSQYHSHWNCSIPL